MQATDASPAGVGGAAPRSRPPEISAEVLAWAAVITLAALLRLVDLGRSPFAVAEGARSLDAALVSRGHAPDGWAGDLTAAVTSLVFRIFGEGEVGARLVPALAGAALIPALWWWRSWVGRIGALAAATFVGFSPLFVLLSRSALPHSAGAFLAVLMSAALFAYLREPRPGPLFVLALSATLALLSDAVGVTGVVAVAAFLAVEAAGLGSNDVAQAWARFRSSPLQMASVAIVALAGLELGLTHFGTSLDKGGVAGLRSWSQMFELPRDSRQPEYYLALLLAYDWPIVVAGVAGLAVLAARMHRGLAALSSSQRFLLVWTAVAALTLAFATRREAGQLLLLLVPLALMGGIFLQEAAHWLDWPTLRRWWPSAASSLLLLAYAAMAMTRWSAGNAGPADRFAMVVAIGGSVLLAVVPLAHSGRRAIAIPLLVLAMSAVVFTAHSAMAVAWARGLEPAVDLELAPRASYLRETLVRLRDERGGRVVVASSLKESLGWTLRDMGSTFGGPLEGASMLVAPAEEAPEGFAPLGGAWRVAEGWYPQALLRPRGLWRWVLFREPYEEGRSVQVRIYVPLE